MRKDNSGVGLWARHTKKAAGIRRRVNKGVRRNTKNALIHCQRGSQRACESI